ncbi:hypothetical protein L7F22_069406 [Adiantum nelumboides]|nr:hypothetical protein [Adiantum nelumboides]
MSAQFHHEKVKRWTANVVELCMKRLADLDKPFKYVVTCIIMQKNGAGMSTATSCFWDTNVDGSRTIRWENKSMYCIVTVFGLAMKSHNEASRGVVIYDPQGNLVIKRGLKLTAQSNNEAKYATLEKGLQLCLELGIQHVKIKGDALLLVVKQVLGVWQSKNPRLKNMCFHVKNLLKHFEAWSLRHIDRSHNEEAHATAQAMIGQSYVMRADSPLYLGRVYLDKEEGFLQTGLLPAELEKSKKYSFLHRAKRYVLVGDRLYMKGDDLVMRRVTWKEEIYKVLEENHEGSCGGHFASKITLHKILQEGYV